MPMTLEKPSGVHGAGAQFHLDAKVEVSPLQSPAIVVISPCLLIRDCLARALKHAGPDFDVHGFSSVAEWRAAAGRASPAIVALYISRSGYVEAQQMLARDAASAAVVAVTDEQDPDWIVELLNTGARAIIPTTVTLEVAVEAIRLVLAGGTFVPASALIAARNSLERSSTVKSNGDRMLTGRQAEVVEMLRIGKPNKIIAYELDMKESTVKVHVRNIMKKLKATNRTQVAYLYQAYLRNETVAGTMQA
jgi:DNA-binding NarL/FixJ family response regulator